MADSDDHLKRFFGSHTEELLVAHVLREVGAGRDLAEILADPYVTNRVSALEVRALLDNVEITRAVGAEAIERISSQM